MGTIKTTNIEPIADNGTVTLGSSGDTFTVPSGVTVNMSSATQTGVGGTNTPSWLAYLSSAQSISNQTATTLCLSRLKCMILLVLTIHQMEFSPCLQVRGKIFVTFATRFNNWNYSDASIYINDGGSGLLTMENGDTDGDNNTLMNSGIVSLSEGATIKVDFYQNGGGTASMRANQSNRLVWWI